MRTINNIKNSKKYKTMKANQSFYNALRGALESNGMANSDLNKKEIIRIVLPVKNEDGSYPFKNPFVKVMWNVAKPAPQPEEKKPVAHQKQPSKKQLAKHPEGRQQPKAKAAEKKEKAIYFAPIYFSDMPNWLGNLVVDLQGHCFTVSPEEEIRKVY